MFPVRHLGALSSWLPRIVLQWPRECKCLFKILIPNPLDVCPEVWFPYSCGSSILIFWGNFILFWQFAIPTITSKGSFSGYIFKCLSLKNKNITIIVQGVRQSVLVVEHLSVYLPTICISRFSREISVHSFAPLNHNIVGFSYGTETPCVIITPLFYDYDLPFL